MSKRELKIYLKELTKSQLQEQVLDLYNRFKPVKTYYNFVFKPNEEKLLDEAKLKISKEYFPLTTRKPKARRSVAQKIIKHFMQLGVDSYLIAEIMLYNMEVAQKFSKTKTIHQDAFYKSMLNSFKETASYIHEHSMLSDFKPRLDNICKESINQEWINTEDFEAILDSF
ncbi:MAG: hypothetical protein COX70_05635 [Flavobacteriales bacterium CG_4_10_14_0_2_um_filter_32_8]|nr:MAG: hypothetical protein COX70_05635 [Flavobacteriales bacterium CG_4_10_14_0_2_um_filter_32_8]PJB14842.1 MAG: hypothetical protein CO118_06455 [Flavobacteriales bacterium CG_4_9_14_3_um_filter_32_8]